MPFVPRRRNLIGFLVCLSVFSALAWGVFATEVVFPFDRQVAETMRTLGDQQPSLARTLALVTFFGDGLFLAGFTLLGGWLVWRRGDPSLAAAWIAISLSSALLNVALKTSFDRERPPAEWRDPSVRETNRSFPSGHSMGSLIGYGLLAATLWPWLVTRRRRIVVMLLLGTWVLVIGFSRIFLRAHWLSDVLAGFAIGLGWLVLCLGFLESERPRRGEEG